MEISEELQPTNLAKKHKDSQCVYYLAYIISGTFYFLIFYWITAPAPKPGSVTLTSGSGKPSVFWEIVGYLVIGILIYAPIHYMIKGKTWKYLVYFKRIRPVMIGQNLLVIIVVVVISAFALYEFLPFLNRSWIYRIPASSGGILAEYGSGNLALLPLTIKFLGLVYAVLLILNLPLLAYGEEEDYRKDTRDWVHAVYRSFRFGLVHCTAGIPMFAGIALGISGLWLSYHYFKGGVERSTAHHLTYNLIIITILVIFILLDYS